MSSWWELGEGSGYSGSELATYRITCPFCMEKGNFDLKHRSAKKKPNSKKKLNFDTLECGNCKGYVMVLWSASEYGPANGIHDFRVLPWPRTLESFPEHWPETVGRYWLQSKSNLSNENWDAATVMARSALQAALRDFGAEGKYLKNEIKDLASKGMLPPVMKDWCEEVRELGNESAHPKPGQDPAKPQDARDIVGFLDYLLEYLYTLPHKISKYRARSKESEE